MPELSDECAKFSFFLLRYVIVDVIYTIFYLCSFKNIYWIVAKLLGVSRAREKEKWDSDVAIKSRTN